MTNLKTIQRLLGLVAILLIAPVANSAFAALTSPTTIDSITVNSNDSIDLVCTDPTFDTGEVIEGREILLDNDALFGSPEVTVGGPADTVSITCDGVTVNNISFVGNYADFDTINVELTVYDDANIDSFDDATFIVADNTKPTVNAPATPATELTNTDAFDELSCTVTDNDPSYGTQACVVTGSIDTSILGLQSADFDGAADVAGNVPDTVTRTVTIVDTTAPTLTRDQANPQTVIKNSAVPSLTATVDDNDNTVDGDTVDCDESAVDNTAIGSYIATCDFTDPSGNPATQVTYTVDVVAGDSPVITLTGPNPQTINLGNPYVELGATASDTEDGDITGSIIIDSSGVNTAVLGSYIVNYDVTDSSGNTDHEERTVNVVTGDAPVITILGNNPESITFGGTYTDAGATASDTEDGDLTGSIITTGLPIDSFASGTYSVTYTVTDSNSNTVSATRQVVIGPKPAEGRSCGGDCYHPHLGVDQNGKVFYEDGLKVNGVTYKIENVLHNHPDKLIELPVGKMVTIKAKAQDTFADNIERCELSVGIPKGKFDKSLAAFKIGINRSFDGTVTNYFEGDLEAFRDVQTSMVNDGNTVMCTWQFVPTKHLEHDMFAVEVMDSYRYTGTYYINEGITFRGISEVGTPVYDVMDSRGRLATITIVDRTLEDLTEAVDQDGNLWHLIDGKWAKDFIRPDMTCYTTDRNCASVHKALILEQQRIAQQYFDSSSIQGKLGETFTYDYPERLPRGEQSHKSASDVCELLKDYLGHNKDVINRSSCKLD